MKHKHANLISEWIKDTNKPVETLSRNGWVEVDPVWDEDSQYRFKEEPVVVYVYASYDNWLSMTQNSTLANIKLTFDNKQLKSVELHDPFQTNSN